MAKRLYRSTTDKIIGGVCGGVARYLEIDATIVRIVWAIVTLFSYGFGLIAYIVIWIAVSEGDNYGEESRSMDPEQRRKLIGGILIGVGGILFLGRFFSWFDFRVVLAILLVAAGVYIIVQKR